MPHFFIPKSVSSHVLMAGNYYKHHHPGGISAVVQYYSRYIEDLQYYPTYKLGNIAIRVYWFVSSYMKLAFRMLFDKNVRIVHLHTAADGSFWRKVQLMRLAKSMGRKVVLHVHASRFKDFYEESGRKAWIIKQLKQADVLIVLSESWKKWFAGIGVNKNRILVLHNITEYPQRADKEPQLNNNTPVRFLFMGEIGERKGVFDILRALSNSSVDLSGKIELRIGGNKHENELRRRISDYKLGGIVKFEGWVEGDKKTEMLNWADVFILPSRNEGLPISILEAMSYGMPVISTPVGGIPEVVSDKNGVLVTPSNDKEIMDAMLLFVNNPTEIIKRGKASEEIVRQYLPDYVMEHLKQIYDKMI